MLVVESETNLSLDSRARKSIYFLLSFEKKVKKVALKHASKHLQVHAYTSF